MTTKQVISNRAYLILCIAIAVVTWMWTRYPLFAFEYAVNDDASQQLIWLNDPAGYSPFDETIGFSTLYIPQGYRLLMRLFGELLPNRAAILFLDLLRCLAVFLLTYKLLIRKGQHTWLGLVLFYVLFHLATTLGDIGMPRSHATIFLLMAFVAEAGIGSRYPMWASAILLSSLFYPPSTIILGMTFLIVHAIQWARTRRFPWPDRFSFILLIVAAALAGFFMVSASRAILDSPIGGASIDRDYMLNDPHASPEGRVNLWHFIATPKFVFLKTVQVELRRILPIDVGGEKGMFLLGLSLGAFMCIASMRKLRGADTAIAMFVSGILLYGLAVMLAFRLFQPNRYIQYTFLPALMMLLLVLYWQLEGGMGQASHLPTKALMTFLLLCAIFTLRPTQKDFQSNAQVYDHVKRYVAPGQMVATNSLTVGDMIPIFTGRSVYVNYESLHAIYYRDQIRLQDRKMEAWRRIFDTPSPDSLSMLLQETHVDGLLLQEPYFTLVDTSSIPKPHARLSRPDNALSLALKARTPQSEFTSAGKRFRWYDLRGTDLIPAQSIQRH